MDTNQQGDTPLLTYDEMSGVSEGSRWINYLHTTSERKAVCKVCFPYCFVCVLYNVNMIIFSTAVFFSPSSRGGLLPNNTVTAAENELYDRNACSYYCFVWLHNPHGRTQQTIIERERHTHAPNTKVYLRLLVLVEHQTLLAHLPY